MKILVIGGLGFIGSNLVKKLVNEGHQVTVFNRENTDIINNNVNNSIQYIYGDFNNINNYEEMFKGVDYVYHLISTTLPKTSNDNIEFDIYSNVISTVRILEFCVKFGVKKIIYTSSGGTIYGVPQYSPIDEGHPTNPICSYGISKLSVEKYLYMFSYLHGLNYQVLRISNPYGPFQNPYSNQGAISVFLNKILKGQDIEIWGDGMVTRDYIYIDDVIEALYKSMIVDAESRVLNVGSGVGTSLNELIDILMNVTRKTVNVIYKDARNIDISSNVLDITKITKEIKWEPQTSFRDGVEKYWWWLNSPK